VDITGQKILATQTANDHQNTGQKTGEVMTQTGFLVLLSFISNIIQ
jgi:hypothetical protein